MKMKKRRKITVEELTKLVDDHELWLRSGREDGEQLILTDVDLSNDEVCDVLDFRCLDGAHFINVSLEGGHMRYTSLREVIIEKSNFNKTDLHCCSLLNAFIENTKICNADLRLLNCRGAEFREVDFTGSKFFGCNLDFSKIVDSIFTKTTFRYDVTTFNAWFFECVDVPYIRLACPDTGSFIGWKAIRVFNTNKSLYDPFEYYIVKLEIPSEAKRSSATGNKCRCEYAKVLEIQDLEGNVLELTKVLNLPSVFGPKQCLYKVGEIVYPDSFDNNRYAECTHGIHFFINRQDAVDYVIL